MFMVVQGDWSSSVAWPINGSETKENRWRATDINTASCTSPCYIFTSNIPSNLANFLSFRINQLALNNKPFGDVKKATKHYGICFNWFFLSGILTRSCHKCFPPIKCQPPVREKRHFMSDFYAISAQIFGPSKH